MSPTKFDTLRLIPAKKALADLSKEDVRRFFYQTHSSAEFQGAQAPEDSLCENFLSIHTVGQRDSKYMKYQYKHAPFFNRSLCEHTRAYHAHDLSDHAVSGQLADVIKEKQGVGRPKKQPPFLARTKYTDDYKKFSRTEARGAIRPNAKPVYPTNDFGIPYHPLLGTEKLEETVSHEHNMFGPHPLELAKSERVKPPKDNLYLDDHMVPSTTAYREEFFSPKGVPRRFLRKPTRCRSAPAVRGPVEALPNWMRESAAQGKGWAESRVVPRHPQLTPNAEASYSSPAGNGKPRQRPASAGALGRRVDPSGDRQSELTLIGTKATALERQPSAGRVRAPSEGLVRQPSAGRARKPIEIGGELTTIMEQQMGQGKALDRPPSANRVRPTSSNRVRPPSAARARPPSAARAREAGTAAPDVDASTKPKQRPVSAGVYRSSASFTDRPTGALQ